ncbi:DUF6431 domain-containing protein [Luteolibacter arcticus]|nr:DUF6431 domain-containing protein [Luteolibacter arcticus]
MSKGAIFAEGLHSGHMVHGKGWKNALDEWFLKLKMRGSKPRIGRMQILARLGDSPETYVREKLHAAAMPPACCPNCQCSRRLQALGYYERGITSSGTPHYLRFQVRRFRCMSCRRTTSVLPDFSQPYRLIANHIIGSYFRGRSTSGSQQWSFLLNRYWNRFSDWLPLLAPKVRKDFRLRIPDDVPDRAWACLESGLGEIGIVTRELTIRSRITLFGAYLCHQPGRSKNEIIGIHTTVLLRVGKDPPD